MEIPYLERQSLYWRGPNLTPCHYMNRWWSNQQTHTLQWRHNRRDSVSNHQLHHCLLNRLFRRRSKKTSKLCVTGLCVGNSPVTGEFPAQMASNGENVSIRWRHHEVNSLWLVECVTCVTVELGYHWHQVIPLSRLPQCRIYASLN